MVKRRKKLSSCHRERNRHLEKFVSMFLSKAGKPFLLFTAGGVFVD